MHIAAFYENILQGALAEKMPLRDVLKTMQDAGLEKLYVGTMGIEWTERAGLGVDIFELCDELGIGIEGMHGWFDFGHNPEDEGYKDFIDLAVRHGAGNVLIVPGMIPKEEEDRREELIQNIISAMRRAVAYGREKGIAVSMEDFDGLQAPYCTVDGLDRFMREVDGLQCSFDTGNFVMYHEDELEAFERFRDKICTMHLKDRGTTRMHESDGACVCADGVELYPAPVGYGVMHIKEIIDRLKAQGYDGGLIVEIFGCDGNHMLESVKKSIEWIKSVI